MSNFDDSRQIYGGNRSRVHILRGALLEHARFRVHIQREKSLQILHRRRME